MPIATSHKVAAAGPSKKSWLPPVVSHPARRPDSCGKRSTPWPARRRSSLRPRRTSSYPSKWKIPQRQFQSRCWQRASAAPHSHGMSSEPGNIVFQSCSKKDSSCTSGPTHYFLIVLTLTPNIYGEIDNSKLKPQNIKKSNLLPEGDPRQCSKRGTGTHASNMKFTGGPRAGRIALVASRK